VLAAALGIMNWAIIVGASAVAIACMAALLVACFLLAGLFTVNPNQGRALQLFSAYRGSCGLRTQETETGCVSGRSGKPAGAAAGWASRADEQRSAAGQDRPPRTCSGARDPPEGDRKEGSLPAKSLPSGGARPT